MSNRFTNIIAASLLVVVFLITVFSIKDDSLTFDETAHIAAGYSYLTQRDYRLNPEHPPLIKNIAALPLLFLDLNFPKNHPSWAQGEPSQWWDQFDLANQFLYHSDNNPDQILFWARIPMILLLVFLGWFLFKFSRDFFGNKVALLVLTLFAFSPTFLAHGRLVTNDVGATLGVVLATYFWLKFLKGPTKKNIFLAGLIFGISMLIKFSLVLLIPFFGIITIIYAFLEKKSLLKYTGMVFLAGIIGLIFMIWPIYQLNSLNYPIEKQLSDTTNVLESSKGPLKNLCIWMADKPLIRPFAHYLLGILMAMKRTAAGNTVYFIGMISGTGWWFYFPIVYFLKIPLAFHILTLVALFWSALAIQKPFWVKTWERIKKWVKNHFSEFSMIVFLAIYWFTSMSGKLNIGVRHILPTFPFIYILVSLGIVRMIEKIKKPIFKKLSLSLISILLIWYISSSLSCFPYYISYFNEIGGGYKGGYKYVVDSNYDWGQDLKRLKAYTKEKQIEKIHLDYFGGGDPEYYLGEKYERLDPKKGPVEGWVAVSINQFQGGIANPAPGFDQPIGYYDWLNKYQPVARAGTSIFIYHID